METEEILYGNRSSPSFGRYSSSYSDQSKQSAIRTSFFALRNNILEELKTTNSETVCFNPTAYVWVYSGCFFSADYLNFS